MPLQYVGHLRGLSLQASTIALSLLNNYCPRALAASPEHRGDVSRSDWSTLYKTPPSAGVSMSRHGSLVARAEGMLWNTALALEAVGIMSCKNCISINTPGRLRKNFELNIVTFTDKNYHAVTIHISVVNETVSIHENGVSFGVARCNIITRSQSFPAQIPRAQARGGKHCGWQPWRGVGGSLNKWATLHVVMC